MKNIVKTVVLYSISKGGSKFKENAIFMVLTFYYNPGKHSLARVAKKQHSETDR